MGNDEMMKGVMEAVEASLPGQVAGQLADFIERAQENEAALKRANRLVATKSEEIDVLEARVKELEAKVDRSGDLDAREREVEARELRYDVGVLQTQLDAEKRVSAAFHDFTMGLVRNVEYRREVFHNNDVQFGADSGVAISPRTTDITEKVE